MHLRDHPWKPVQYTNARMYIPIRSHAPSVGIAASASPACRAPRRRARRSTSSAPRTAALLAAALSGGDRGRGRADSRCRRHCETLEATIIHKAPLESQAAILPILFIYSVYDEPFNISDRVVSLSCQPPGYTHSPAC